MSKHPLHSRTASKKPIRRAVQDLGRAVGGALIFSLPILMTMEMWWLGFLIDRPRLLLLIVLNMALLTVLSRHIGFERTGSWEEDIVDAAIAFGVGLLAGAVFLGVFGVMRPEMALDEIIGKIVIQAVPGSIGALLARSQFARHGEDAERRETYLGELFLMLIGALFLGFNLAPTDEMVLISYQMSKWHALALVVLSLAVMHGFVFALGFRGGTVLSEENSPWRAFLTFTLPGYVIAAAISLYVLWTFGRIDGESLGQIMTATVVLAFPSSVGAAAARLIV